MSTEGRGIKGGKLETWQHYTTVPAAMDVAWHRQRSSDSASGSSAVAAADGTADARSASGLRDIRQLQCRPFATRFCNSFPKVHRPHGSTALSSTCLSTENAVPGALVEYDHNSPGSHSEIISLRIGAEILFLHYLGKSITSPTNSYHIISPSP